MGRLVVPLLACVAFLQAAPLFAADDPKALVEKAIKAKGGAETLEQCTAVRTRYTGHFGLELGADSKMSFKGEMYEQRGGQVRMSFSLDLNGTKMDLVMVSNGDKSWQSMNGAVSESPFNTREYQEQVAYQVTRALTAPAADLDDQQYAEAVATLGEQSLVELTTLVGYYATLALQLRIFRVDPQ